MNDSSKAQRRQMIYIQLHTTSDFRYQTSLQLPAIRQALKGKQSKDRGSLAEK